MAEDLDVQLVLEGDAGRSRQPIDVAACRKQPHYGSPALYAAQAAVLSSIVVVRCGR
ncbi:MAG: hypothetical protein R3E68_03415 [Burkholderiaceae bacterium]